MKMKMFATIAFGLLIFGCGMVSGKSEGEKVAKDYMDHRIKNGGFGNESHYSDFFWTKTNQAEWKNITDLVEAAMGNLKSYELKTWNVNSNATVGAELNGTIVRLVYETVYEKGKAADTITVHQPIGGGKYKIVGVNFSSVLIQNKINEGIKKVVSEEKSTIEDTDSSEK